MLRLRGLFCALTVALAVMGASPLQAEEVETPAPPAQILVMLRLPEQHYRPNSTYGSGYGNDIYRNARRRQAAQIAKDHALQLIDNWPMPLLGVDCFVMTVPDGRTTEKVAEEVSRDHSVVWYQPLHVFEAQGASAQTGDPLFPAQPATRDWRLADLHKIATGRGVSVAVIDSAIESGHPDLRGQVTVSKDFVVDRPAAAELHGTGVAGVIAAIANNGVGVAGIAPRARLMGLRACWQAAKPSSSSIATMCDSLGLAKALHFAIEHKARIINMSLSGPADPLLAKLVKLGMERGITVVAAFDRKLPRGGFPASYPGVIAVSDTSLPASLSGVYTAPGNDVPTTQPGGRWFLVNGSSYAAAHVSGLVALIREKGLPARASSPLVSAQAGGGAINACATLVRAAGPCDCSCSEAPKMATRPK